MFGQLWFESLLQKVIWEQESMHMYGKMVNLPRLTAWYGDTDKNYSFSGITLKPNALIDEILIVKTKVEQLTNNKFNSVLLNRYRNGNDSISWHTDAEKELGKSPVIASVNFGAERKFQIRHIKTKEKKEIVLSNGCLIIMQGEFQHYWQHQVPKTNTSIGERINLTFRQLKGVFKRFERNIPMAMELIDRSFLSEEMRNAYKEVFESRYKAGF